MFSDDQPNNVDNMEPVDMRDVVGHERCTNVRLEELFMKEPKDSPYKYKMALMIFIEGVLVAKDKKTMVNQHTINLVSNLELFESYPWGRYAYLQTKRYLQSCDPAKSRASGGYTIGGFPLALQVSIVYVCIIFIV